MEQNLTTVIGVLATGLTTIGGILARDRYILKTIREGDENLHKRINHVKDEYVSVKQLTIIMSSLNETLKSVHDGQNRLTERIDRMLEK